MGNTQPAPRGATGRTVVAPQQTDRPSLPAKDRLGAVGPPRALRPTPDPHLAAVRLVTATLKIRWGEKYKAKLYPILIMARAVLVSKLETTPPRAGLPRPPAASSIPAPLHSHLPRVRPSTTAAQFYSRTVSCTPAPCRAPPPPAAGLGAWCTSPRAEEGCVSSAAERNWRYTKVCASPAGHRGEEVLCPPRHRPPGNGTRQALLRHPFRLSLQIHRYHRSYKTRSCSQHIQPPSILIPLSSQASHRLSCSKHFTNT